MREVELHRVAIHVPSRDAELHRARLLELAPDGFEERDIDDGIELAVYVDPARVDALLDSLTAASVRRVAAGWDDAWRRFHRPVVIAGLWIGPPWEAAPVAAPAIVIEPGRAFGTGAHPTTRLCIELLASTERRGSLLDVGCGSGVLAIAAARLGFDPVLALDHDPVAIETTRANACVNEVRVETAVLDAENGVLPAADIAVANVLLRPVEAILARLEASQAITSGYLTGERPAHPGWLHVESIQRDGWAADRFCRR